MAKLVILYGHPTDPAAFEDYYADHHLPFAGREMPNVRDAENARVLSTPEGEPAPFYRIAQMSYDTVADLRVGVSSEQGRAVLADLANFATGGATTLVCEPTDHSS